MNKHRLNRLADLLETIPTKKFDMQTWGRRPYVVLDDQPQPTCFSAAYALGWATTIPYFHKLGLRFEVEDGHMEGDVRFGRLIDTQAGRRFFSLTMDQAQDLFLGGPFKPKEKAKQIRAMAKSPEAYAEWKGRRGAW